MAICFQSNDVHEQIAIKQETCSIFLSFSSQKEKEIEGAHSLNYPKFHPGCFVQLLEGTLFFHNTIEQFRGCRTGIVKCPNLQPWALHSLRSHVYLLVKHWLEVWVTWIIFLALILTYFASLSVSLPPGAFLPFICFVLLKNQFFRTGTNICYVSILYLT